MGNSTKNQKLVSSEAKTAFVTNDWSNEEAKDFLIKGGIVTTKVTNYSSKGEITHYCITEKQVPPNYKLHLIEEEQKKDNKLANLKTKVKNG